MANIKSAIKRNRQNAKRAEANKGVRSQMRTYTKKALAAAGTDESDESLRLAIKNNASRKKSRLTKAVNAG